jgi:predicted MFS family arabinose efflux permease
VSGWLRATFGSLSSHNYRLYFTGNTVSQIGTWMQRIGQVWLVLELTGSGTWLGVTAALQHLPLLLVPAWGGALADRMDKRRLILWSESCAGACALLLGLLTARGLVELWMVLGLALLLGTINALDEPAKKTFVFEMVGPGLMTNAITLNSVVFNIAKAVGPALAGVLISTVEIAASFFVNAGSYFAVVLALALMRVSDLQAPIPVPRRRGQMREGLRYVRGTPGLAGPLMLMTVSGVLAYEWAVTLPLLATDAFGGDATTFGLLFSAMGVGAVVGGLLVAGSLQPTMRALLVTAAVFSTLMVFTALSPSLLIALAALVVLGGSSIAFRSLATALLQIGAAPEMRGRVMALLTIALTGTTPIGAPLVGWIGETVGARFAFGLGGVGTALAALGTAWYMRRCEHEAARRRAGMT